MYLRKEHTHVEQKLKSVFIIHKGHWSNTIKNSLVKIEVLHIGNWYVCNCIHLIMMTNNSGNLWNVYRLYEFILIYYICFLIFKHSNNTSYSIEGAIIFYFLRGFSEKFWSNK